MWRSLSAVTLLALTAPRLALAAPPLPLKQAVVDVLATTPRPAIVIALARSQVDRPDAAALALPAAAATLLARFDEARAAERSLGDAVRDASSDAERAAALKQLTAASVRTRTARQAALGTLGGAARNAAGELRYAELLRDQAEDDANRAAAACKDPAGDCYQPADLGPTMAALRRGLAQAPGTPWLAALHYLLGVTLSDQGDRAEASAMLAAALADDGGAGPLAAELNLRLGMLALEGDDHVGAAARLDAVTAGPLRAAALALRIPIASRMGECTLVARASAELRGAPDAAPYLPDVAWFEADCLLDPGSGLDPARLAALDPAGADAVAAEAQRQRRDSPPPAGPRELVLEAARRCGLALHARRALVLPASFALSGQLAKLTLKPKAPALESCLRTRLTGQRTRLARGASLTLR
ncbi:MAG: hypothetical protein IT370_17515 [Deltaproteobacteria bacterium]|nr:hypothetical protein [Deltaproteobacteria bacterium]